MEQPTGISILGKSLKCPHCGGDKFLQGEAMLNTAGLTFLDLEWLNRSAKNYICSQCGRIEWFLPKPDVPVSSTGGDIECLECGSLVPDGVVKCPKCGWSYDDAVEVTSRS